MIGDRIKLEDLLDYIQPNKYIVSSEIYSDEFETPVLTAGKTFLLGYTNDKNGIFHATKENPVILFDDFTTDARLIDFDFKVKSSACKILVPKRKNINLKYVFYALKCVNINTDSHKRYWISVFSQQLIYYPSKEKQEEIVNSLESIESIINQNQRCISSIDELIKSSFLEQFGDPNINEKGWQIKCICEVAKCIAGATPKTNNKQYWDNGTIPWMSSGEVNKGRIFDTDSKITKLGYDKTSTKLVPAHTVVVAMAGQGKTRGTAAVAEISLCTNQSCCSIVQDPKQIDTNFLYILLKLQYEKLRNAANCADGRGGLNLKIIGSFKIYVPPIDIQNQFSNQLMKFESLKARFEKRNNILDELLKSRIYSYFM